VKDLWCSEYYMSETDVKLLLISCTTSFGKNYVLHDFTFWFYSAGKVDSVNKTLTSLLLDIVML